MKDQLESGFNQAYPNHYREDGHCIFQNLSIFVVTLPETDVSAEAYLVIF